MPSASAFFGGIRSALDRPFIVTAMLLCPAGALWALPFLAMEGGGWGLLLWMCFALLVGLPLVLHDVALGSCLQGPLPDCLRRASRPLEWVGWWGAWCALALAVLVGVLGSWALVLCFDAAIDTFGNLSGPWGVSEEEPDRVDRYLADLLGAPQSAASLDASGMTVLAGDGDLRPRGPVLVAFAVFWFLVQRFLRLELRGLMALVRIAAPVAALILLMLGLLLVGLRVGATHGLAALFTPAPLADGGGRFWCWALAAPILASGLGTGVLIGFTGGRPRTGDATGLGTAAFAFVLVIQVLVLAVVVAGLGVAAVAVDAEAGQLDPHPARILLGHMPLALSGSTGPPWLDGLPVLAWLAVVVVLCLISCIALLIGPLQALRRAFDGYSEEFAMRLSAAALLISLPFATGLGWDGWAFFALLLGSIILPAAIVAQVFASAVAVGLDGLVDHVRAYSTIPLGFLWRMTMIAIPAVMVILVVVGALVLLTAAWADGPRAIVFALVPAVALPLAGWLTVKRRRRRA